MAKEDALLAETFYGLVLPSLIALAVVTIVFRNVKSCKERLFAWIYSKYMLKDLMEHLAPHKEKLFAKMRAEESHFEHLRIENSIRILEIGSGPGANFTYFPQKCNLVCYDPNPHFNSFIFERCAKFPDIQLERVVISGAENLVDTQDESVDVVVCTLVLCSVQNVENVLKEVKRVLVPGGKLYFMEHVKSADGSRNQLLKRLVNPLWKVFFLNCHLTRDIAESIRKAEFSKVDISDFRMPSKSRFVTIFVNDCVLGIAEK